MTGNNPSPSDFVEAALNGAQVPATTEDTGSDLMQAALGGADIDDPTVAAIKKAYQVTRD